MLPQNVSRNSNRIACTDELGSRPLAGRSICHQTGSAVPRRYAKRAGYVTIHDRIPVVKLAGSKFGTPEDIAQMTNEFDKTTKLRFSNPAEPSYIRFGTVKDRDLAYNIKSGQLKLPG